MTLKLNRIIEDLADSDREIQILALTTIPRIANDLNPTTEDLARLNDELTKLAASRNPDIVFLARKAQNTLARLAATGNADEETAAAASVPPPAPFSTSNPTPPEPIPIAGLTNSAPKPPPLQVPEMPVTRPSSNLNLDVGLSTDRLVQKLTHEEDAGQLASLLATARGMKDPRLVEKATPMLGHPDPRVRANAVEVFEELGLEKHLPLLLPLLHDENNRVKSNAIKAVGRFDASQVTHGLQDMLRSELVSMRESGLYALINLPEITDVALIAQMVEDPYDSIRQRLVGYLASHPHKDATALLEKLVLDKDAQVRDAAVEALVKRCVSVDGLLAKAASPPEPPVPDPAVTPIHGIPVQPGLGKEPVDPPSRPRGLQIGALVDEAVERGFRATLAQLLKELKSSEKRAILARALYQAGLKGYQACRRGDLKDKEALSLYYEIDRYQDFLRDYTKKLNLEDATVDKLQRQIVVSGLAQYQGRLKVSLVKLGRLAAEAAKKGIVDLPAELLKEIETLAPPPASGL